MGKIKNAGFGSICAKDFHDPSVSSGSHTLPLFATSTFIYENPEKAMRVFRGEEDAFIYSRWSNPTVKAVEEKIAALESFDLEQDATGYLYSSGMAAISAMLLATLKPGDAILTQGNLYGTTTELLNTVISDLQIEVIYADLRDLNRTEEIVKKGMVKLIYAETPANPTLDCYNIEALSVIARQNNIKLAVDNTFSTPYFQQPFRHGADFIIHSTTKFLNGHGTALGGIWLGMDQKFMKSKGFDMRKLLGGNSNPFDAWLLNNGIKTLPLRMDRHQENAMKVAQFLLNEPAVERVNFLGLSEHPDQLVIQQQMTGYGGMVSFELRGGLKKGIRFMESLKFCSLTASLGTTDTLIQHPASMTHIRVPKEQREKYGISDGLIRMSVGLEDIHDIIDDLRRALNDPG